LTHFFFRSDPQASLRRPATTVRTNCAQIFLDLFLYLFGNYRDFIVPAKPTDSPTPRPGGRERYTSTILQRGDLPSEGHLFFLMPHFVLVGIDKHAKMF
jgi:hypothetical protein